MSEYLINGSTLTAIGDAIREKTGSTDTLTPSGMATAIVGIEVGGGNDLINSLMNRTISSITNGASMVSTYVFASCTALTTANFPSCKWVGFGAFSGCTALTTVSFPVCTSIGSSAFQFCRSLTTASFPYCATIEQAAFSGCTALTTANFPYCTRVGPGAFTDCTALTTVSFPVCTSISNYAFSRCSALTTVSFPDCSIIGSSAFRGASKLSAIILKYYSVCSLKNSTVFMDTPIASGTGYIYVPSSLVARYQSTGYWSLMSAQISAIEDSEFA